MKKYVYFCIAGILGILFIQAMPKEDGPATKAELGKLLFFDTILSKNRTVSCATCHRSEYAFADTSALSKGVDGKKGIRNTPSAMNLLLQRSFFWDGRAASIEAQALEPIKNPVEMNLPVNEAVARLRNDSKYGLWFKKLFNSEPDSSNLAIAIASFERTLETSDSPFDKWKFSGDSNAVSASVKRGFIVFNTKGKCISCHFGANFTANEFRNIGLFDALKFNDSGRTLISGKKQDIGKFKTPALRNVSVTAPYMHNGMFRTLKEVINFYDNAAKVIPKAINRDTLLAKPLHLTIAEKKDLETFLVSLTDKQFASTGREIKASKPKMYNSIKVKFIDRQ